MKKLVILALLLAVTSCSDKPDDGETKVINSRVLNIQTFEDMPNEIDGISGNIDPQMLQVYANSDDPSLDREIFSSPEQRQMKKVLIAGDSWAFFQCLFNSMGKTIKKHDLPILNDSRCLRSTKPGIEARQWLGSKQDERVRQYLEDNKNIEYLILTLGGNDLMAQWNKFYTVEQEQALFEKIYLHIEAAVKNYQKINPNLKIIVSGYDYPHFQNKHYIPVFKDIFKRMFKPQHDQINYGLIKYSQYMAKIRQLSSNVHYIHHLGVSQYHDGVSEYGVPKRSTLPPVEISTADEPEKIGGNPKFPSSDKSMIYWFGLERDAIHLDSDSYENVFEHIYQNRLKQLLF